jgi:hypothetical protein
MLLFTRKKISENSLQIFKKAKLLIPNSASERANFNQIAESVIFRTTHATGLLPNQDFP